MQSKTADCISDLPKIALAGNPNVGKSSVFNILTGLHQHTGNWSGKTVGNFECVCNILGRKCILSDLPGTYSMTPSSYEEKEARDYIVFEKPDLVVYVCGALSLERNLICAMQISEFCDNMLLCINMCDEAERKGMTIDTDFLSQALKIPVVKISAKKNKGIAELNKTIISSLDGNNKTEQRKLLYSEKFESIITAFEKRIKEMNLPIKCRGILVKFAENDTSLRDSLIQHYASKEKEIIGLFEDIVNSVRDSGISSDHPSEIRSERANRLYFRCVIDREKGKNPVLADKIMTGRFSAFPIMLLLLALIFYITIRASNLPSDMLNRMFSGFEYPIYVFLQSLGISEKICSLIVYGIFRVVTWIISVMLPPMAIFFPMFTILEDSGILPRIAFNLDGVFSFCGACGKQALTMCMGYGCNAVGVSGCRIIDSERERLIAVLTNVFSPCNGRFPLLIVLISMFFGSNDILQCLLLACIIIFSVIISFIVSKLLSVTILKGKQSSFILELPPYRMPKFGQVILYSLKDRTLFVLARAVAFAIPSGAVIWLLANIYVGNVSLLTSVSGFLDPFAKIMGLDGVILLAFILGMPANEIIVPIIMMTYLANGVIAEYENVDALKNILVVNGWTFKTAICTCMFCVMHWPCAATLMTIHRETKSVLWTVISFIIPTLCGFCACSLTNFLFTVL